MGRPTPPLTTDPCEIDWKEKRVKWTKPWWNYFDALQRTVDIDATDEDVIDAFTRINGSAVQDNPALTQFLQSSRLLDSPDLAAFLQPQRAAAAPGISNFPSFPSIGQSGLQAALLSLATQRKWSDIRVITDTWAKIGNYASAPLGSLYFAIDPAAGVSADRAVVYVRMIIGAAVGWVYLCGYWPVVLASLSSSGLGANDTNLLAWITDYSHLLRWNGSAWEWGPSDPGSGFYQLFEAAPSGFGASAWQICDGSTVARLNADGTTTNVTVPDVTTAAYLKGGITSAAVAAASGLTASVSGGTPAGTNSAPTFTGDAVKAATTDGTIDLVAPDATATGVTPVTTATGTVSAPTFTGDALAGHTHGPSTLELRNKQGILYYRR